MRKVDKVPESADKKLLSAQTWRTSRLEAARVQHAEASAVSESRQLVVDAEQRKIEDSHEIVRAQTSGNMVISVDALMQVRHFTCVTLEELRLAQKSLEDARNDLDAAHSELMKRMTDLRAVERVREKRKTLHAREEARREQRRLDDHGVVRHAHRGAEKRR